MKFIEANLKKPVTFKRGQATVTIPEDTVISVNQESGYAIWNGQYFDIFKDEYALTQ